MTSREKMRLVDRMLEALNDQDPVEAYQRRVLWLAAQNSSSGDAWVDGRWDFYTNDPYYGPLMMVEILGGFR